VVFSIQGVEKKLSNFDFFFMFFASWRRLKRLFEKIKNSRCSTFSIDY
jgi:hypothetical protein